MVVLALLDSVSRDLWVALEVPIWWWMRVALGLMELASWHPLVPLGEEDLTLYHPLEPPGWVDLELRQLESLGLMASRCPLAESLSLGH